MALCLVTKRWRKKRRKNPVEEKEVNRSEFHKIHFKVSVKPIKGVLVKRLRMTRSPSGLLAQKFVLLGRPPPRLGVRIETALTKRSTLLQVEQAEF